METNGKDRIIVALDVDDRAEALRLIRELRPHVGLFKFGLELVVKTFLSGASGAELVEAAEGNVMLDLKFNDIPNTVGRSSSPLGSGGVRLFTVHASNGTKAMEAVAAAKGGAKALAVTVLTSFDEEGAKRVFSHHGIRAKVLEFAVMAQQAGLDGIVCAPDDLCMIQGGAFEGFLRVTPNIRPTWMGAPDDQNKDRSMAPADAILAGADYLVIGRPITKPPAAIGGPTAAARLIADEIDEALRRKAILKTCTDAEKGDCGC